MAMALGHFAFGAAVTTLIVTFFIPTIWYPRTIILAGGGWAMVPDLHWVSPFATQQLHRWHKTSVWTDLFWFHRTWDRIDPNNSTTVAAGLLAFLIIATAIAEYRNYRALALIKSAYESYVESDSID